MRVVREQMLCIISPRWPGGAAVLESDEVQLPLRRLLDEIGVVHFASLALLPPRPNAEGSALPSLMFELAVDEGVRPADLLARLVGHPGGALWTVYEAYFPTQTPGSLSERNAWMLQHLHDCLSVATGGFVGARDRSLSQIKQEHELYLEARLKHAQLRSAWQMNQPGAKMPDRDAHALAMAQWASEQSLLNWRKPSPRSYWRGSAASSAAKVGFFLKLALLAWGVAWMLQGATHGLQRLWSECTCDHCCRALPSWLSLGTASLLAGANVVSSWLASTVGRLYAVLAVWLLLYWIVWIALPALVPAWQRWQERINRELDRPTQAWSSRLTYLVGWLLVPPFAAALIVSLLYVVSGASPIGGLPRIEWPGAKPMLTLLGLLGLFVAVFVANARRQERRAAPMRRASTPRGWFTRRHDALTRWFYRPYEDAIPRAQQVHPTIERCEAELVAGTGHMISLTELRWPCAWSAWWTLASLRVVTFFGHVVFTEGRLGDAPGIHFGHWHIVDGGRRLLFVSNFDGYFGGYLDDFINGAPSGVNLAWRWTRLRPRRPAVDGHPEVLVARRFPPTRFLIYRGVKCELRFKAYARESMVPHLFRFDASGRSLDDKNRATALRDALYGERTGSNDDQIMRMLES